MNIKFFIQIFLLILIVFLCGQYLIFDKTGIKKSSKLKKECCREQEQVFQLKNEIKELKHTICGLQTKIFEKEKIIREDLQLSCTNEYIYVLKSSSI